jgi:hypothetical protein
MLTALIPLAGIGLLVVLGHLVMNAVNERRDLEFYEALVRIEAARREPE